MAKLDEHKKARYLNLLILVVILIVVPVFSSLFSKSFSYQFTDSSMTITDPDETEYYISYDSILSMELLECPDWGSCISGGSNNSYCWGVWENSEWGQYILCAYTEPTVCILIRTDSQTVALNYETDEVTQGLLASLTEAVEANQ